MAKRKVSIRFYTDAHGNRKARYFFAMQWRQITVSAAKALIAAGDAKIDIRSERLSPPPDFNPGVRKAC